MFPSVCQPLPLFSFLVHESDLRDGSRGFCTWFGSVSDQFAHILLAGGDLLCIRFYSGSVPWTFQCEYSSKRLQGPDGVNMLRFK